VAPVVHQLPWKILNEWHKFKHRNRERVLAMDLHVNELSKLHKTSNGSKRTQQTQTNIKMQSFRLKNEIMDNEIQYTDNFNQTIVNKIENNSSNLP